LIVTQPPRVHEIGSGRFRQPWRHDALSCGLANLLRMLVRIPIVEQTERGAGKAPLVLWRRRLRVDRPMTGCAVLEQDGRDVLVEGDGRRVSGRRRRRSGAMTTHSERKGQ